MNPALDEKFSGHESFVCRYGWLRKAFDAVQTNPAIFRDVEGAIVSLGVGSNMVKSLEFWGRAFDIIKPLDKRSRQYETTAFGRTIFDRAAGKDPYCEDLGTLWLLHWKLVTRANLAAWNLVFQELRETRVRYFRLMEMLKRRGRASGASLVEHTVRQHIDALLRTYAPTYTEDLRSLEESLGSPLQELGLLTRSEIDGEAKDSLIEIMVGPKAALGPEVFLAALVEYWERNNTGASLSLQEIMLGRLSPGVVFKLDEASVIEYLALIPRFTDLLAYADGALTRAVQLRPDATLAMVKQELGLS